MLLAGEEAKDQHPREKKAGLKRSLLILLNALMRPCALNSIVIAELPAEGSCDVDTEPWTLQFRALL
jgi:hypothetical protein